MPTLGVDTLPSQRVPQKILKKKYLPILYGVNVIVVILLVLSGEHKNFLCFIFIHGD